MKIKRQAGVAFWPLNSVLPARLNQKVGLINGTYPFSRAELIEAAKYYL